MSTFDLYKPFRNKVAALSYDDAFYVIWAYSQYLQIDKFQMPGDIEVHKEFRNLKPRQIWVAEWELEILAKEVILHGSVASKKGRRLHLWKTLSETINHLKDLENEIARLYGSGDNILMELIRIAHRQFVWQINPPNSVTIIRYFKIFGQQTINKICVDRLGLTVKEIYLCGTAFMGVFLSHPAINVPFKLEIEGLSEEKFQKFISFTCKSLSELKSILNEEQRYDEKFAYAYNSLRAYPLIRMRFRGQDAIACPLPTLLFWRMTGGLYYELLEDMRFSNAYGHAFQNYVGNVIERSCPNSAINFYAEQQYGTKKERKDSIDWIVSDDVSAIFLECKAKRLSWSTKEALDDAGPLQNDIEIMADALVQMYKTIGDYLNDRYPYYSFSDDRKIYPVVVTLENWHMFGPVMFDMLEKAVAPKLQEAGFQPEYLLEARYSVWSIEELEVATQIINVVGIREFMDGKLDDPEMRRWEWHPYMTHRYPDFFPAKKLFTDEYDKLYSGLGSRGATSK